MIQIIIRGINDASKPLASNSNLTVENVVSFLANYAKPKFNIKPDNRKPVMLIKNKPQTSNTDRKCYACGKLGDTKAYCRTQLQQRAHPSDSSTKIK